MFARLSAVHGLEHPPADAEIVLRVPVERSFTYPCAQFAFGAEDAAVSDRFGEVFRRSRARELADVYFAVLEDATVLRNGFVLDRAGNLVLESIFPWAPSNVSEGHPVDYDRACGGAAIGESVELECAVHLRSPAEPGYFHWVQSTLPRLLLARDAGLSEVPWLIDAQPSFVSDALRLTGYRLPVPRLDVEYRVKRLYFPAPLQFEGDHFYRPQITSGLLRRFAADVVGSREAPQLKLYIARSDARIRRLHQEAEVVDRLAAQGFRPVVLSAMSFEEQIRLFSAARLVVAPHGAGLANIAFMPEGGRIVEMLSPARLWPTFKCIADRSRLAYAAVCGSSFDQEQTGERGAGNEDFSVQTSLVVEMVDAMTQER